MEGRRQIFDKDVEFHETWIDRIVAEKRKVKEMFEMNDGGEYLRHRLPKQDEKKEGEEDEREKGEEEEDDENKFMN